MSDSHFQNQIRLKGISMNLKDANVVSNFRKGRSRDKALKNKYEWKFKTELPGIIEYLEDDQVTKLADNKAGIYQSCIEILEGFPGSELYEIYKEMQKKVGPVNKIRYILRIL